jgi:hypothetical protein
MAKTGQKLRRQLRRNIYLAEHCPRHNNRKYNQHVVTKLSY